MTPLEAAKRAVAEDVRRRADLLVEVSHRIHGRPELLFEEHYGAELLAEILETAGLRVQRGICGLPTAFSAEAGNSERGPRVAVMCEYDALPGIGHACGHNVIGAAGLGAGLAAAALAGELGGRLVVLGTPAEEGGGGKVLMLDAGAFEGVDAALMVHPAGFDLTEPEVIAIATLRVTYSGVAAHAAASPWRGRNALDAAVLGYNAVAALRQHIQPEERVHGVFTEAGTKPNIVPERAVAEWYVRSRSLASLAPLKARVLAALEAGAAAAGCRMEVTAIGPEYSHLDTNGPLLSLYRANSASLGRIVAEPTPQTRLVASTDAGNVSLRVPTIHPMVKVAPEEVALHSPEFAGWAVSADADRAVVEAATAMAMTVVDLWLRPDALADVRRAFESPRPHAGASSGL